MSRVWEKHVYTQSSLPTCLQIEHPAREARIHASQGDIHSHRCACQSYGKAERLDSHLTDPHITQTLRQLAAWRRATICPGSGLV